MLCRAQWNVIWKHIWDLGFLLPVSFLKEIFANLWARSSRVFAVTLICKAEILRKLDSAPEPTVRHPNLMAHSSGRPLPYIIQQVPTEYLNSLLCPQGDLVYLVWLWEVGLAFDSQIRIGVRCCISKHCAMTDVLISFSFGSQPFFLGHFPCLHNFSMHLCLGPRLPEIWLVSST